MAGFSKLKTNKTRSKISDLQMRRVMSGEYRVMGQDALELSGVDSVREGSQNKTKHITHQHDPWFSIGCGLLPGFAEARCEDTCLCARPTANTTPRLFECSGAS